MSPSILSVTADMSMDTTKKVLIVGAGPVGSLTALTFHKRGWNVEIWEGREGKFSVVSSARTVLTGSDRSKRNRCLTSESEVYQSRHFGSRIGGGEER